MDAAVTCGLLVPFDRRRHGIVDDHGCTLPPGGHQVHRNVRDDGTTVLRWWFECGEEGTGRPCVEGDGEVCEDFVAYIEPAGTSGDCPPTAGRHGRCPTTEAEPMASCTELTAAPATSAASTWAVLDYDGRPLPGRWDSEQEAVELGLAGRYLLSGYEVAAIPA